MDRTATDTIKGFNYQFNKTILEIVNAEPNTKIILEGYIEDIDVFKKDKTIAVQCKYYESQKKLNTSVLTKPILDMIMSFIKDDTINYKLYIHCGDSSEEETIPFNSSLLNDILKTKDKSYIKKYFPIIFETEDRIKNLCLKHKPTSTEYNTVYEYYNKKIIDGTIIYNFDKSKFIESVEIISAPSNEDLVDKIIETIASNGYTKEEVYDLFYPNMFQKVACLSSEKQVKNRTIICGKFKNDIFTIKSLLTSKWLKKVFNVEQYKKSLKRNLKLRLQGNSNIRVIILDADEYRVEDITSFVNDYVKKYNKKPKLNNSPLFIIKSNEEEKCSLIQQSLYKQYNLNFEDGDVGKKFNLNKLMDAKEVDLKICYIQNELINYMIEHKPDDVFIIGSLDTSIYEKNGVECCKIEGLNINEIKEIFFLGGKYEGSR